MTTLEQLEDYAYEQNINVQHHFHISKLRGFCIISNGRKIIALNKAHLKNNADETSVLAEEIGHLETNSLMPLSDYMNPEYKCWTKAKNEIRAKRWAIDMLVPVEQIQDAIEYGCRNSYEIAEYCEVDVAFLEDAFKYYQRKGIEF